MSLRFYPRWEIGKQGGNKVPTSRQRPKKMLAKS